MSNMNSTNITQLQGDRLTEDVHLVRAQLRYFMGSILNLVRVEVMEELPGEMLEEDLTELESSCQLTSLSKNVVGMRIFNSVFYFVMIICL